MPRLKDIHLMRKLRFVLRWLVRLALLVLVLLLLAFVVYFRGALYNRFVQFPREARAWEAIRSARVDVTLDDGWQDFRGVCHSHSELSHDCDVPFEEILRVLKETDRDFICMSDHCEGGKADFSLQWDGMYDGVVFVPGYEMSYGFMPWGLPRETVLDCGEDEEALARRIADLGGMLFFAHTEEDRRWDLPELTGMEIYNIHTDFKDLGYAKLMPDMILNLGAYPDQTFRLIFDRQTAILDNWDRLNKARKIVGIAANDCHQNNGIVGIYTADGKLLLRDTSPDDIGEYSLNFFTRLLLRVFFGPLEPNRQLFHFQLDPYERMVRYVSTHILAKELSKESVLDALRQGRVYVAFDMIADSTGFTFLAEGPAQRAVMGESASLTPELRLRVAAPHRCRFTIKRDGETVAQQVGTSLSWEPDAIGKYRVEAELEILGEWTPWVYTNPIEITEKPVAPPAAAPPGSEAPAFGATSEEPVLPRYAFSPGWERAFQLESKGDFTINIGARQMVMPVIIEMEARARVLEVDDAGAATIELQFTRYAMDMNMFAMQVKYDTASDAPPRQGLEFVQRLVEQPARAKVSSRGQVLEHDVSALVEGMDASYGPSAQASLEETVLQMLRAAFLSLPEGTVQPGAVFDAGAQTQTVGGAGVVEREGKYKVGAIEAGGRRILLEPAGKVTLLPVDQDKVKFESRGATAAGWVLVDLDQGCVAESFSTISIGMEMTQIDQKFDASLLTESRFRIVAEQDASEPDEVVPIAGQGSGV